MKKLLPVIFATLLFGCGKSASEKAAYSRGEADAATLIETISSMSEMQFESYLLNVRANEYSYVTSGDSAASVSYIEGFEDYLKEHSDSISSLIL